jgi:adenylate cyclase
MSSRNLSIRITVILIVIVNIAVVSVAIYGFTRSVLLPSYLTIEEEGAERNLERARNAIDDVIEGLQVTASDWSTWDDAYSYVLGENESFEETDLTTLALQNLSINAILFMNTERQFVFTKGIDIETEADISLEHLTSYLAAHPALTRVNDMSSLSGIVQTPHGPLLMASHPVVHSDGTGPVAGLLFFGKLLNDPLRETLEELTNLSIQLFPYDATALPEDVQAIHTDLLKEEPIVRALSEDRIAAYQVIRDIDQQPILILRIDTARPIYAQGITSLRLFTGLTGFLAFILSAALLIFFERLIIARLMRLEKDIRNVGSSPDAVQQVREGRQDELGRVAHAVNRMLTDVAAAEETKRKAAEKISAANEEALKQLAEIKKMNDLMVNRELKMVALKKENAALREQIKKP